MRHHSIGWAGSALALVACCLAACTNGVGVNSTQRAIPPVAAYTVTGTVSGLSGSGLVLQDNGADNLALQANGSFTFPASVLTGNPFNVTVLTQPVAANGTVETCTVSQGAGTIASASVTNVVVTCVAKTAATDIVTGSTAGLAGTGLILQNSDGSRIPVSANGTFTIASGVGSGTGYAITVLTPPTGPAQDCAVINGSGTTGSADIGSIVVNCHTNTSPTHSVGGTVTGLSSTGATIVLLDNSRDPLTVTADGPFTFPLAIPTGSPYSVTAQTSGSSQSITCVLSNGSGVMGSTSVTNVAVSCQINTSAAYTIGGTVTGISGSGANVVLKDSSGGSVTVSADGAFTLPSPIPSGSQYSVSAQTSSPSVTCSLSNGSGTVGTANVANIAVSCRGSSATYTVGGTVTGISGAGASVVLTDNGGDSLTLTANGSFTFATSLATGGTYSVAAQPSGNLTCTVTNGSGTIASANVTNVTVSCQVAKFTIGGTVTGVSGTGGTIQLSNNDSDLLTLTADGAFTFATPIASGSTYLVAASSSTLNCTVTNGSGTVGTANVTNVAVSCALKRFTIGGTVTGLSATGGSIVLTDNGGDALTLTADGPFTFATTIATGSTYSVSAQTTGIVSCTVSNATGTVSLANVTNVAVGCGPPPIYIPFQATTVPGAVGQIGLFVIPSNNLTAAPVFVNSITTSSLGRSIQATLSNGLPTSYTPYATFYSAVGVDKLLHIYAVGLSNTSAAPTLTTITSQAPNATICDSKGAQTDLKDPKTSFLLLHIGGPNGCGNGGDVYQLVRYTDSASSAPTTVAVTSTAFDPVYLPDGTLSGVVLRDPTTLTLNFYANPTPLPSFPTFTNPKVIGVGVTANNQLYGTVPNGAVLTPVGNALFEQVTNDSGTFLYRIDSTGNATQIYRASGTLSGISGSTVPVPGVGDDSNVYFTDKYLNTTTNTNNVAFVQAPLGGGAPTTLYIAASNDTFVLVGSNGANLAFIDRFLGICTFACSPSQTLDTLPVGVQSTAPTPIASGGTLFAYQVGANPSASVLLVGTESVTNGVARYASQVVSPSGQVVLAPQANSFWLAPSIRGTAVQVEGITATDGSLGGGSLLNYNAGTNSFAAAPFAVPGGNNYVIPAGQRTVTCNPMSPPAPCQGPAALTFVSPTVGDGLLQDLSGNPMGALAFDENLSLIAPISVTGSTISLY
jgi:hypothetical protein